MAEIRYLLLFFVDLTTFHWLLPRHHSLLGLLFWMRDPESFLDPVTHLHASPALSAALFILNHNKLLAATVASVFQRACSRQHQQPVTVKTILQYCAAQCRAIGSLAINSLFLL